MFIIAGLGNPGREYEETRHNIGFLVVDELADRAGVRLSDKKFKAIIARGRLGNESCLLMKPQTFMNLSGEAVGPSMGFYKATPKDVIVIHDDMDIEFGRLKLKVGGGHGGHNGLRSMLKHLPNDGFIRVRVGVSRPPPRWDPADYVLSRFTAEELSSLDKAVNKAADAVEAILKDGYQKAMNKHNRTSKQSGKTAEKGAPGAEDLSSKESAS